MKNILHKWQQLKTEQRPFFVLSMVLLSVTILNIFTTYNLWLDSDGASANILAREQIRMQQLFPDTWHTSTSLIIFVFNILMIPLSLLTQDQLLLRNVAVLIVLIVFVLVLGYLSKKIIGSDFYFLMLCLFFSSTSNMMIDMSVAEAAYLVSFLDNIILLCLFLKAVSADLRIKSKLIFGLLLAFCSYLSLNGALNFAYQIVPLLGAVVIYFIVEHAKDSFSLVRTHLGRLLFLISIIIVSVAVGFLGFIELSRLTGFKNNTNIVYVDNATLANHFVQFVLNAIGYKTGVLLFSIDGLMNIVVVFANLAMIVCCVLLFRRYVEQSFEVKILMNFSLVIFCIFLYFDFVQYSMETNGERYLFKPLVFLYMLSAYYIWTYILRKGFMIKLVVVVAVMVFTLPNTISTLPYIFDYKELHTQQTALADFLVDSGLKRGYATFWNAGNNMVLSNFEVEIGPVFLTDPIQPHRWLTSETLFDGSYQGETFLLLTDEEYAIFQQQKNNALLGQASHTLTFHDYKIIVYPDNMLENRIYKNTEIIDWMITSDADMKNSNDQIEISSGQVVFGPYIHLPLGKYEVRVTFSEISETVIARATKDSGKTILEECWLTEEETVFYFESTEACDNFEIFLTTNASATLTSVKLSLIS